MKKRHVCIFFTLVVLLCPFFANAHDIAPPAWRGQDQTLYALWDDWNIDYGTDPPTIHPDDYAYTPTGLQEPIIQGMAETDGDMAYFHFGVFSIWADNFDNFNPIKYARLQITVDTSGQTTTYDVATDPAGGVTFVDRVPINGTTLATDIWDFVIQPNPDEELFLITWDWSTYDQLYIDQIVLDTICIPVPGVFWLLSSGLIYFLLRRKK